MHFWYWPSEKVWKGRRLAFNKNTCCLSILKYYIIHIYLKLAWHCLVTRCFTVFKIRKTDLPHHECPEPFNSCAIMSKCFSSSREVWETHLEVWGSWRQHRHPSLVCTSLRWAHSFLRPFWGHSGGSSELRLKRKHNKNIYQPFVFCVWGLMKFSHNVAVAISVGSFIEIWLCN